MKRVLIVIILTALCMNLKSQDLGFQAPDYNKISIEIKDKSSNYYYPKLMSRLIENDTTLTQSDYNYLYFGYIFQKEYQPYWSFSDDEKLIKYYRSSDLSEKDYDKIIKLSNRSISEFPFDLRTLNFLAYVYHLKGDEDMSYKISRRFQGIYSAIMLSGDGKTCENAFHVISVSHEYVFLMYNQLSMQSQSFNGSCDYLSLKKNESAIEGIYFNVSNLFGKK